MKKPVKIVVSVVVGLVVVLLAVVLTLPLTIGPLVKTAASVGGPAALGVPVSVGDVTLNALGGNLTISQVKVGNPKGYSTQEAFAVEKVEIVLSIASLMSDTIIVKKIRIDAPAILYESKEGKSNFDAMLASAKKKSEEDKTKSPSEKKAGKKVVIEEFTLNGAKLSYASPVTFGKPVTLPVPALALKDIGKSSGGTTFADALTEVIDGMLTGVTKAVSDLAGSVSDLSKGATTGVTNAAKGATDAVGEATKGVTDAAKGATDSVRKLFK
jgi:hypothetical protein